MIAELPELGCELDGYYWGTRDLSPFLVDDITYDPGEIRTNDTPAPREDGVRHGKDYLGGMVVGISIVGMHDPRTDGPAQMDAYGELRRVWRATEVRAQSGAVCVLRMGRAGRTRRVYGRPRGWLPTLGKDSAGHTFVTAQFECRDDLFYGDNERSVTVTILPPAAGGFTVPVIAPWRSLGVSYSPSVVRIGGDEPAWPTFLIRGPISRPTVDVVGHFQIGLDLALQPGETVGIDPRPWSRSVRSGTAAFLTRSLLPGSPSLAQVKLPPGAYSVVLRGTDPTGTASLTTAWREAFTGP